MITTTRVLSIALASTCVCLGPLPADAAAQAEPPHAEGSADIEAGANTASDVEVGAGASGSTRYSQSGGGSSSASYSAGGGGGSDGLRLAAQMRIDAVNTLALANPTDGIAP